MVSAVALTYTSLSLCLSLSMSLYTSLPPPLPLSPSLYTSLPLPQVLAIHSEAEKERTEAKRKIAKLEDALRYNDEDQNKSVVCCVEH